VAFKLYKNQMNKEVIREENKMGVMPIKKLLFTMSVPMMISMTIQALYNIVDSIFVSMISEDALTAVTLAFPIQMLLIAVGVGTGAGVNAVLSRALGEKDFKKANKVSGNAIFIMVCNYVVFFLVGLFCVKAFYYSQTDDRVIAEAGILYLTIISTMSFGVLIQFTFERLLQSTGRTFYTMITQATGAIINIILDPILIFGLFGFPEMGIAGAAIATIIGQSVGAIMAMWIHFAKNKDIKITLEDCKPNKYIIGQIYVVGIPAIVMQAIASIMIYGMNMILIGFSETAATVLGVYFKLQSFIFMPVFGLTNGMISIAAYNYGARNKKRFLEVIKTTMISVICIMVVGSAFFIAGAEVLLSLFNASDLMLEIGIPALRIIGMGFVLAGYSIVLSSIFQSLGNGVYSMIISVVRQLVAILPIAYLLSFIGVEAVWWAFTISELITVAISTYFFLRIYKSRIKIMES